MKRESPIASTVSNLTTSWVKILLGLVTGIIVTRALGPQLKGEYAALQLVLAVYLPLMILGYQGGVLYYGLRKSIDLKQLFWSGFLLTLGMGLVAAIALHQVISRGWLGEVVFRVDPDSLRLFMGAAPLVLLNNYCERVLKTYHQFKASNARTIAGAVLLLVYFIIVLLIHEIGLRQAILGVLLSQSVQLILNIRAIVGLVRPHLTLVLSDLFKPWHYGIRIWFSEVISKSNDRFDQIVLTFFLASGPFGVYSVGVGLSSLLILFPSSYVDVLFNQMTERGPDEALRLYAKAQRISFLLTAVLATLLGIVSYPLILILYGQDFTGAAWVVVFYAPGLIFQVAARLSMKVYVSMGRPLKTSLIYVMGFLVGLPFYFLLIPKWGIIGAAASSSIAYFSAFVISFLQIRKEFQIKVSDIFGVRGEDLGFIKTQITRLPLMARFSPVK